MRAKLRSACASHVKVTMSGIETPVRDRNVFVKVADGSTTAITVHKAREGELMNALHVLAPRAATGFSQEREAQFKCDPRSLIDAGPL